MCSPTSQGCWRQAFADNLDSAPLTSSWRTWIFLWVIRCDLPLKTDDLLFFYVGLPERQHPQRYWPTQGFRGWRMIYKLPFLLKVFKYLKSEWRTRAIVLCRDPENYENFVWNDTQGSMQYIYTRVEWWNSARKKHVGNHACRPGQKCLIWMVQNWKI